MSNIKWKGTSEAVSVTYNGISYIVDRTNEEALASFIAIFTYMECDLEKRDEEIIKLKQERASIEKKVESLLYELNPHYGD